MGLISAGMTDIGMKRKTNQDAIYLNPEKNIFVMADGMGGHNGGDIASTMAVKHVHEYILNNHDEGPELQTKNAIKDANTKIKQRGEKDPLLEGMGTTVVSFYFKGDSLFIGNVGDSRAYLVNNNKLFQLTKDHTLIQEKLNMGIYDRERAKNDPQKNVLIRTVGFQDKVDIDVYNYKVSKYDIFLNCSDGLYGKVSDPDIVYLINKYIPDPKTATFENLKEAVVNLINLANKNGGNDNISVILVLAK